MIYSGYYFLFSDCKCFCRLEKKVTELQMDLKGGRYNK
jgi:hypothetical protein